MRAVRGVLVIENQETGDGRVFEPGAFTWVDPPLPLAWMRDGDQHVDLSEVAPQIGTIDTITRVGNDIEWTGTLDDENVDGAEVSRRMVAGTAPLGPRFGLSIDWDNWSVEVIDTEVVEADADGEGVLIVASGAGRPPRFAVAAAAGDPDPGPDAGVLLFAENSGTILERHTAGRIRGATLVSVGAFAGAFMEFADDVAPAAAPEAEPVAAAGAPALVLGLVGPDEPPAEWFDPFMDEPDGSLNITADGQVFGYIAAWDSCHTGYTDRCVPPPREDGEYDRFMVGAAVTEEGTTIPVGVFTWNAPHAALSDSMMAAQEHYAHSACAFARARVGANQYGIWHAGAVMPGTTRSDLNALRSLALSGDWRYDLNARQLRLIASLAVNYPGFTVKRRGVTAAGVASLDTLAPAAFMDGDRITALTSAGVLAPVGDCGCHGSTVRAGKVDDLSDIRRTLHRLDLRTKHLIPQAMRAAAGRTD